MSISVLVSAYCFVAVAGVVGSFHIVIATRRFVFGVCDACFSVYETFTADDVMIVVLLLCILSMYM